MSFTGNMNCYNSTDAQQYRGHVAKGKDGTPCMAWSEQTPHKHTYADPTLFPNDKSVVAANNYCRDPSNDGRPWCYTVQESQRWEWCNVPPCKYRETSLQRQQFFP